ncbi:MAG: ribosome maturation factor RimP [Lachnospiraceae bacterium]|nr:ribosome maturation factor RimP [Lachnospiraceae bacterium]
MSAKQYEEMAESLVTPITESMGISVYDVEYVKEGGDHYLRIYIDKPGGVNINDCEAVSRAFSDRLDEVDPIPDAYIMEVSSPGLGRSLKKDRHFEKSIGAEVDIKLFEAQDGTKEYSGVLKAFDKDTVTITVDGNEDKSFARKGIASTRLKIDF